jgi:DNA-directed RNA polymerase specialized sigma24 family protein
MSFPETRLTLIQRLVAEGGEEDWRTFVGDYWGPVCRFAQRWGAVHMDDAEDVALETFEILWRSGLLVRWMQNRSAKLRTLVCSVVRNNLANRGRVRAARQRIASELCEVSSDSEACAKQGDDVFYDAWVEDLLDRALKSLAADYGREGKGDYLRVLYGRICDELTIADCAATLALTPATVDNYFRHARKRLGDKLRECLQEQIVRYAAPQEVDHELKLEWQTLGTHLTEQGGLEQALRRTLRELDAASLDVRRRRALARLSAPKRSSD